MIFQTVQYRFTKCDTLWQARDKINNKIGIMPYFLMTAHNYIHHRNLRQKELKAEISQSYKLTETWSHVDIWNKI